MKKFITKKKISIPRYQVLLFIIAIFVGGIILFNSILNKMVNDEFTNVLINNTFGGTINHYKENKNLFYKNIYGLNISENENSSITNKPLIYLYNTNQNDKYKLDYKADYSTDLVVTRANLILQEYLKKEGINSIVETSSIFDISKEKNTDNLYDASRVLLEEAYKKNPSLEYFIDIKISDKLYDDTTVQLEGESYARISFIISCENKNYKSNEQLATNLHKKLEKYPSISKGLSIICDNEKNSCFNQDFHKNTLLLEVGGIENKVEEVTRTMEKLAYVLKEEISGKD